MLWPTSEPMRRWVDAMTAQTLHEIDCWPCRHYRLPSCDEGRRLKASAVQAWQAWVSDTYAGPQTLDDAPEQPRLPVAGRLHPDVLDVRLMPVEARP